MLKDIKECIEREVQKAGYELVMYKLASNHPSDSYLYLVIASKGDEYVVWKYNSCFNSLFNGEYGIPTLLRAKEILRDREYIISGETVNEEFPLEVWV